MLWRFCGFEHFLESNNLTASMPWGSSTPAASTNLSKTVVLSAVLFRRCIHRLQARARTSRCISECFIDDIRRRRIQQQQY
jgi:hypothetical protein